MNQDIGTYIVPKTLKQNCRLPITKLDLKQSYWQRLTLEDQCVQSMPNASPTKWHLAHTTGFLKPLY